MVRAPVAMSQYQTVALWPIMRILLSAVNAIPQISECPRNSPIFRPVCVSPRRTVPIRSAAAIRFPSGENAA